MNSSLITLELCVIALGIVLMLADFFVLPERKKYLAYGAIVALTGLLVISFSGTGVCSVFGVAFHNSFVEDPLALFFKRFFITAAILVLFLAAEFSDRIAAGISEYYSLVVFALAGMLFAASADDFTMLFVSIELITITFYVLVSFQKNRLVSLEAAIKYLILGALSSAFMVFGIALIWGTTGKLNFTELAQVSGQFMDNKLFLTGVLFVLVGLGFKIAAFPFQIWAPDVYQGAPTPTTAFLAVGSKAAGFVLLLRVLFIAVPQVTQHWTCLLTIIAAITILYGNLCA
ncbi:MAG TPA: proton-conducting transporter membrane subunit, partial [Verrucomicrobiae bacterium]